MKNPREALRVIRKLETWVRTTDQTGGSKHATSVGVLLEKYQMKTCSNSTRFKIVLGRLQIKNTRTMMNRIRLWWASSAWNVKLDDRFTFMTTVSLTVKNRNTHELKREKIKIQKLCLQDPQYLKKFKLFYSISISKFFPEGLVLYVSPYLKNHPKMILSIKWHLLLNFWHRYFLTI